MAERFTALVAGKATLTLDRGRLPTKRVVGASYNWSDRHFSGIPEMPKFAYEEPNNRVKAFVHFGDESKMDYLSSDDDGLADAFDASTIYDAWLSEDFAMLSITLNDSTGQKIRRYTGDQFYDFDDDKTIRYRNFLLLGGQREMEDDLDGRRLCYMRTLENGAYIIAGWTYCDANASEIESSAYACIESIVFEEVES